MESLASSEPRAKIAKKWRELFRLIPGYDPISTAPDGAWFDAQEANLALDFFPTHLRHVEGELAGKPFVLQPWQQAVTACIFGWKAHDSQGRVIRRYRESFLYVSRKNGKTPWCAGIGLFVLFCDDEAGQQNYIAAADREQAGFLFRQAKGMVEQNEELSSRCRIYGGNAQAGQSKSIVAEGAGSFLRVISADAETKHGGNSHLVMIDELHTQPNRELVDVLSTSMASQNRKQPLFISITTADFDRPSICNEKYDYACKVRDGIIKDPSFLPVIYEADREDDWTSEEVWKKANPNLGVSVSLDYLRRECAHAKEVPAFENTFKRLHLDMKTTADINAVPMEQWEACGANVYTEADLDGLECFGGLDLASTTDVAAFVLTFPINQGGYALLPRFWIPREGARLRGKRDRVPYEEWGRQGFLKLTEGNVIDYDVIREDINALRERFNIREVAADRWNATQIINQLQGDGVTVIAFGQGFKDMTAPTKELLKLVTEGKLYHSGHPVLRWMASNLSTETDAAGNLKPSKKKSTEKIDGMVAAIMAIGRAMLTPEADSPSITFI